MPGRPMSSSTSVGRAPVGGVERRRPVVRDVHVVAEAAQQHRRAPSAASTVVVDDQHAQRRRAAPVGAPPAPAAARRAAGAGAAAGARRTRCPRPGPSLCARRREPPCSSTSAAHQREADAEAALRAVERARRPARTGRRRAAAARPAMPTPLSRTRIDDLAALARGRRARCGRRRSVYLAALLSRLASTCDRRVGVGLEHSGSGGSVDRQRVAALLDAAAGSPRPRCATSAASVDVLACAARSCRA